MKLLKEQHMERTHETEGMIFKIKRFSIHDGPGIRTSVFLKGCPLNCAWCHSPEGISSEISIWYSENLCIGCGQCVQACPNNALHMNNNSNPYVKITRGLCKASGDCVKICPTNALQLTGSTITASEIIDTIENDLVYYRTSGGGVTLTGGEPLYQPGFSTEVLKECRKRKIHTAIETCLFCEKDLIHSISDLVDLFIVDIKLFDPYLHKYYTGKTNEIIKENFRLIADRGKDILVRIPIIDNITNNEKNIKAIIEFVNKTGKDILIEKISFNPLTENSYKRLGIPFSLNNM